MLILNKRDALDEGLDGVADNKTAQNQGTLPEALKYLLLRCATGPPLGSHCCLC